MEFTLKKVVVFIMTLLVIFFGFFSISSFFSLITDGTSSVSIESEKAMCENGLCNLKSCEIILDCSDKEILKWNSLVKYSKKCDKNLDSCDSLQLKVKDILEGKVDDFNSRFDYNSNSNFDLVKYDSNNLPILSDSINSDITFTINNLKKIQIAELDGYSFMIEESRRQGLDPIISLIIISIETGGRTLVSSVGAAGIMQIMPCTARGLGLEVNPENYFIDVTNVCNNVKTLNQIRLGDERFIPKKNIEAGIKYLVELRDSPLTSNNFEIAAAYNGGLKSLKQSSVCPGQKSYECIKNSGYFETRNYVEKFNNYAKSILG